jgi:antitoxin component YwqK of YwqJK toxin-antitoxin module
MHNKNIILISFFVAFSCISRSVIEKDIPYPIDWSIKRQIQCFYNIRFKKKLIIYHTNGKMAMMAELRDGKQNGTKNVWDSLGNLTYRLELKDNLPHGKQIYWNNTGIKESEMMYKNGILHGKGTIWYPNGNIKMVGEAFEGEEHGQITSYYKNKQIKSIKNRVKGVLNGQQSFFWPNGNLAYKLLFKNGELIHESGYFDHTGKSIAEEDFHNEYNKLPN